MSEQIRYRNVWINVTSFYIPPLFFLFFFTFRTDTHFLKTNLDPMSQQKEGWVLFLISHLPKRLCFRPCPFAGSSVSRITQNLSNGTNPINFSCKSCKSFLLPLTLRDRVLFCVGSSARILMKTKAGLFTSIYSNLIQPIQTYFIWYWIVLMEGYCWALVEGCNIPCAILVL